MLKLYLYISFVGYDDVILFFKKYNLWIFEELAKEGNYYLDRLGQYFQRPRFYGIEGITGNVFQVHF